jgi:hypothetical protein
MVQVIFLLLCKSRIKTITASVVSILDEKLKSFGFKPSGADKKSISQKRLHTALVR